MNIWSPYLYMSGLGLFSMTYLLCGNVDLAGHGECFRQGKRHSITVYAFITSYPPFKRETMLIIFISLITGRKIHIT
jgi:hypothetical protein